MPPQGRQGSAARATAKQAQRLARLSATLERREDAQARALARRVTEAQAYAAVEDAPPGAGRTLAPHDPSEVLKHAPVARRALLIINAKSGPAADSLLKVREIADLLARHGIGVDVRVKLRKSLARRDARRAAKEGYRLVIAAGGDGTVAAVARGLIGTKATLGIIPLGTYNNTAASLGIPSDLGAACALLAAGVRRWVDVGEVRATGKRKPVLFLEVGAVGLAAALAPVGQHLEKGRWQEARSTLPTALSMEPTPATICLDDERPARRVQTLLVVVANGPRAGAGMDLAPSARMDDGLLDVHMYADVDQAALATRAVAAEAGAGSLDERADHARARKVRVETVSAMPVVADSKVVGITPATFRVRAAALRVIAGNGPGLARPVPDSVLAATAAAARALPPAADGAAIAPAPAPADPAVRALSELVPAVAQVVEHTATVRSKVLPLGVAAMGGALLSSLLRRAGRR